MEPATFLKMVARAIAAGGLLAPAEPVLVGLSGGPDSVVLLHSLLRLGYSVVAAHFDHALRAESAADAEWVLARCAVWGVKVVAAREAEPSAITNEAHAREARYAFFEAAAQELGMRAIVLGHHDDDQAETVLFRLIGGAGMQGLGAMRPTRTTPANRRIVRPLLGFRRKDLEEVRQAWGLPALQDASNADTAFSRNRLRHTVMPTLEALNPATVRHLASFAATMRESAAAQQEHAHRLAKYCLNSPSAEVIEVDRATLLALPVERAHWLLKEAAGRIGLPVFGIGVLNRCLQTARKGGNADIGGNFRVEAAENWLVLTKVDLGSPMEPFVPTGAQATMKWGWQVNVEKSVHAGRADAMRVSFDAKHLPADLVWRAARPKDDLFQPWDRATSQGLGTFLTRQGIASHRQATWLVLAAAETVAWVVGIRRGRLATVTEQTTEVVEMQATAGFRV